MRKILLLLFLTLALPVYSNENGTRPHVKITDSKDNKVTLIKDEKTLNRFNFFWSQKQMMKKNLTFKWRYQFIIYGPSGKSKWVYDPRGYAREITMDKSTVTFKLVPIVSFNGILKLK